MSHIILERFANREIRIGAQSITISPIQKGDKKADFEKSRFAQKILDLEVSRANLRDGWELGLDRRGAAIAIPYTQAKHEALARRLDLRNEFQQRSLKVKNKGGWGFLPKPTKFGKNARHRLLEAGAIMDSLCGKNVCEVTCTIPGSTRAAFRTIAKYSGWIMNRITQIVRRSKHNPAWFYVWELQERGALHLHFAIGASTLHDAVQLAEQIEFRWFELLLELRDKTDVDCFDTGRGWSWRNSPKNWKSHVLPVWKSVGA